MSTCLCRLLLGIISIAMVGCVYDDLVIGDESGFSRGPSRFGALHGAKRLPLAGEGYWIPPRWSQRGLNYGVDEMLSLIVYTGRELSRRKLSVPLGVGDISLLEGGRSPWHRSHQTGRDVDLLFFVKDAQGRAVRSSTMWKHNSQGEQILPPGQRPQYFFDAKNNWILVEVLLDNPVADIQYIFVQDDLRNMLLDEGAKQGASTELLARAAEILKQPSDSAPHNDHFHLRIYCSKRDLALGCVNFGQMRWHKRDLKYARRIERLPWPKIKLPKAQY